MSEKAVIDRFEGNLAVLTLGEGDTTRTLNVPKKALPRHAKEGTWLQVELDRDHFVSRDRRRRRSVAHPPAHTGEARATAQG